MERYDLGDKLRDRVSTRKFFFNIGTIARTSRRVVEDRIESNRVEREVVDGFEERVVLKRGYKTMVINEIERINCGFTRSRER